MKKEEFIDIIQKRLYEDDVRWNTTPYRSSATWEEIPYWLKLRYQGRAEQIFRVIKEMTNGKR